MPIHVLKAEKDEKGNWNFDKVIAWTDEYVQGKDYTLLVTDENEIIIEPRKSTRPLDFGYVCIKDASAIKTLAKQLATRYGLPVLEIKSLGWDTEKSPYVKVPVG
jgi:predicted transcriptional regulator